VNLEHDFSIVESPGPFEAGTLIPIYNREKGSGYARLLLEYLFFFAENANNELKTINITTILVFVI